ncbi:FadR/GntR family transcriptional regulator [Devosia honganensis]|uniref:FadR/GntR family transcriptional regulator n=1 Tax=Devosia honganensis TaxID=1610527 RepID=A0ABV7X6E9_9HYPH
MISEFSIKRDSDQQASGYDRVVSFLKEQLIHGHLKEGDMLLPERELALRLNVSRPVVREALRALAIIGAVEIQHGVGTVIRQPDATALGEFFSIGLAHHARAVDDVMEARVAIECQAIRLACARATSIDFIQLAGGIDDIRATIGDPVAGARADFEFHRLIVQASRSDTLISIYSVISDLLLRSHLNRRREVATVEGINRDIEQAHVEILEAIEARDADAADAVLRRHFAIGAQIRSSALPNREGAE